jgi:hypothetical protein
MDHDEQDPARLRGSPEHAALVGALRRDAPSSATNARILAAIDRGGRGPGSGGSGLVGKAAAATAVVAAMVGLGGMVALLAPRGDGRTPAPGPGAAQSPTAAPTASPSRSPTASPTASPIVTAAEASGPGGSSPPPDESLGTAAPEVPSLVDTATARRAPPTEEALIAEAQRRARTDPAAARGVLDQHARLYPDGVLAPERDALRAELAIRHGERDEGEAALSAFTAGHPGSAHAERLRRILDARP